jgi:hypothetical protein
MNFLRSAVLLATVTFAASAADITGTWKAVFLGPQDQRPKTVSEIILNLDADGNVLTGMAHAGNWPGDAVIEDGKIDGDRISFTVVGKSAWQSKGPQGEASGYPRLSFSGTLAGGEMKLTLTWDSVMIYGRPTAAQEYQMRARKASD